MEITHNVFATYKLSQVEELDGTILSLTQTAVLRNKMAEIAAAKLGLRFDPTAPDKFIQQEAELHGQLGVIQWLLDSSDAAKQEVLDADTTTYDPE